jgi:hypothetical protein
VWGLHLFNFLKTISRVFMFWHISYESGLVAATRYHSFKKALFAHIFFRFIFSLFSLISKSAIYSAFVHANCFYILKILWSSVSELFKNFEWNGLKLYFPSYKAGSHFQQKVKDYQNCLQLDAVGCLFKNIERSFF